VLSETPRANIAVWVVAGLVAAFALFQLIGSKGSAGGSSVRIARPSEGAQSSQPAGGREATIYVHVAGAVRRPGLLQVPVGSRVAVAVERAGGPSRRAELAGVNLAAELEDGQQIVVPVRGAMPAAAGGAAGSAAADATGGLKASLATATAEQLDEIDGIGPTLAERIIEYRTEHGGFSSLGELREVEGIGEKRFETLSEALQP
jgi:competence protein ComEA